MRFQEFITAAIAGIVFAALAAPAAAQFTIDFPPGVNVSNTPASTAFTDYRIVVDPGTLEKVHVVTYADGPNTERDIFVRYSVDDGATWSAAVNLSNSAGQTNVIGAPGNSNRPSIAAENGNVLIAWIDTYCPGGAQGSYTNDQGELTAFGCAYVARSTDSGRTWSAAEQLTDGSRDAINTMPAASASGFALAWQEDPAGVSAPGNGGASGGGGSPGTNIHYTALADLASGTPFPDDTRVSNNTGTASGDPAATRPNLQLAGFTALLAYEETKAGSSGKNVLWHDFDMFNPPADAMGAIVNDPDENARRARIVAQTPAEAGASGTLALLIWRQGVGTQGAPADFMARRAVGGYGIGQLQPVINLSGATLTSPTSEDPDDSIRGHRAILDGDRVAVAFIYTPSEPLRELQQATYDAMTRQSMDGGVTWRPMRNLSGITDFSIIAFAPRIAATPATIASGDPLDQRNPDAYLVGWDTRTNTNERERLDVWAAYTEDYGLRFSDPIPVATSPAGEFSVVLQAFPSGRQVCAVWRQRDSETRADAFHSCGSRVFVSEARPVPVASWPALLLLIGLMIAGTLWWRPGR